MEKGEAGFFCDDARKGTAYKITEDCRLRIQATLDKGQSVNSIAKQEGVRESAISYGIKQGYLKKATLADGSNGGSTLNIRNQADQSAPLGIATIRYEDLMAPAVSGAGNANLSPKTYYLKLTTPSSLPLKTPGL